MASLDQQTASSFYAYGENSRLDTGGQFNYPSQIAIGRNVDIPANYWLSIVNPAIGHVPKIIIGDGCRFDSGLIISAVNRIELESNVTVGSRVFISDTDHEYHAVGKPVLAQGITGTTGTVRIGAGTIMGDRSIIAGNISIGRNCIVNPGSVVEHPVPDDCMVEGSPARIIRMYDDALQEWIPVADEREVLAQLTKNENHRLVTAEPPSSALTNQPLLSICIPTYNRASNLDRCLFAILSQLQPDDSVEVIVSDNASTDGTPDVILKYAEQYPQLRSVRNESNIGADRNIFQVMRMGKGLFVKLQGDDDYWVAGTLAPLLDIVDAHRDCGIVHIHVHNDDGRIYRAEGASAFLHATSIMSTFISGMVLRKEDLDQVENPTLFLDSSFNQMYLQYAILQKNPRFCVFNRSMFYYEANEPGGYNFGEVVFRSYQSILRHFVGSGLTAEDLSVEKHRSLFGYILPWYRGIMMYRYKTDTSGFLSLFIEHYQQESYYEQALFEIETLSKLQ